MMYIHPVLQVFATFIAIYVFILGFSRFRSLHLGQKVTFQRKRHVIFGFFALFLWIIGTVLGLVMVRIAWHGFLVTGSHGMIGLVSLFLMLVGLFSGLRLYTKPKKRKILPLIHGLANSLVLLSAFIQMYLGYEVIEVFLQGA